MPFHGLGDAHEASLYRSLVKNLPEYAIFRIGRSGHIESWNSGVERVLGYSEADFLGLPLEQLFTPEDRGSNMPEVEMRLALLHGKAPDTRWHLRKDGSRFFCDGVMTAIHDASGQVIGFTKVMHDVTDRKVAEQRTEELARALDLTHTIIRNVDGVITAWTQGAEFLYGWSPEEAVGRHSHELLRTEFPESLELINERLLNLGEWQGELLHKTKDGGDVSVASHWVLHKRADDGVHVIEVNNDISALKGAQRSLERANKELRSFAYEVAHDIQAPLRGITVIAELLSGTSQSSSSEERKMLLDRIVDNGVKLRSLIESLLQYATVENPADREEVFCIGDVLKDVKANLATAIASTGADVSWNDMPTVRAHRTRVLRVLQNLIGNALKYTRTSVRPVICISASKIGRQWRIDVADNGCGIPDENLKKIFAPLTRLHGGEVAGAGLGLAICKRVIESEGGRIWVDSVPGDGSIFHFTLPVTPDCAPF